MSHKSNPLRSVIFVDDEYRQSHPKKRPAERACHDCRRKKKRCEHGHDLDNCGETTGTVTVPEGSINHNPNAASDVTQRRTLAQSDRTSRRTAENGRRGAQAETASARGGSTSSATAKRTYPRFIGDLNPERELRSPSDGREKPLGNSVGVWHVEEHDSAPSSPKPGALTEFGASSLFYHCSQLTRRLLLPIMEEQCLAIRPPEAHFRAMELFYFENVHPVLPVIDQSSYQGREHNDGSNILQSQAVCLAVHTNPAVRDHLWLSAHDGPLSPAEFGRKLLGAMRLNIELALTTDRAVLIRTLATMSLFAYTRDALELHCQFFVRAAHLSFTIGLHQKQHNDGDESILDGLFCYVWAIDRLHAAMQGRPVIIQNHDMSVTPLERSRQNTPGFRVFVRISALLERAIELYRPNCTSIKIPTSDFPSFEDVLGECEALKLPTHLMETLELFYHAVGILSCRSQTIASDRGFLAPCARQTLSAAQITSILEDDTARKLVLLPYVPYAISLSLSTAHRQIRHSRVLKFQTIARRKVLQNLRHLRDMSEFYWSAAVMAELARKSLFEARSPHAGEPDAGGRGGGSPSAAVQQDVAGTANAGKQTMYESNDLIGVEELGDPLWRLYNKPVDASMIDLDEYGWNVDHLDELLDVNLELSLPNFFPELSVDMENTF